MVLMYLTGLLDLNYEGVKLLLSIFAAYPMSFVYDKWVRHMDPNSQHVYMMTGGYLLGFANFGFDMYHSLINILLIFAIIQILGVNRLTLGFVFFFESFYLMIGYITANESSEYTINWTTAQCVLCLRLIGLMWDLYDGTLPEEKLSVTQKKSAIRSPPTIYEMFGFCYYFGTFLIGPQVTLRRYLDCINGDLTPKDETGVAMQTEGRKDRIVSRIVLGFMCMLVYLLFSRYFYESAFQTEWFLEDISFLHRVFYMTVFGNVVLYRYLSVWLIAEGACVLTGLGYNGRNAEGQHMWDAMANIRMGLFLRGACCDELVHSFNINTNKWMLEYIYKRLRFLNNRTISQVVTLAYLAIWHGHHSGYYVNFFLEFIVLSIEKQMVPMVQRSWIQEVLNLPIGRLMSFILRKLCLLFIMGQALTAFCLLRMELWLPVFKSVYFVAFVFCLWYPLLPLIKIVLAPRRPINED